MNSVSLAQKHCQICTVIIDPKNSKHHLFSRILGLYVSKHKNFNILLVTRLAVAFGWKRISYLQPAILAFVYTDHRATKSTFCGGGFSFRAAVAICHVIWSNVYLKGVCKVFSKYSFSVTLFVSRQRFTFFMSWNCPDNCLIYG